MKSFQFNRRYFLLSLLLLGIEIFIAARVNDAIIRPYGGDFLVVILLYCLVRSFRKGRVLPTAIAVLIFAYGIEIGQYFHFVDRLGLGGYRLARVVLGTYFTWVDLLSYTLGILLVIGVESAGAAWKGELRAEQEEEGGEQEVGSGKKGPVGQVLKAGEEKVGAAGKEELGAGKGELGAGKEKVLFVRKGSIVRRIWGRGDTVLFVFAGAAAEFSLNKAVDWLYYTGRLPADPLGRLFSTVRYAQVIVFSEYDEALAAIDRIAGVHRDVEKNRGARIPDAAYLDVLFMLIDYSIRSFELLERRLTGKEKAEVFEVFYRVGLRMGLKGLPGDYPGWEIKRAEHLEANLVSSPFAEDLYRQYRKHLGTFRYQLLLQSQVLLAPARVRRLLVLPPLAFLYPLLLVYKGIRFLRLDRPIRILLLPAVYKVSIAGLDRN